MLAVAIDVCPFNPALPFAHVIFADVARLLHDGVANEREKVRACDGALFENCEQVFQCVLGLRASGGRIDDGERNMQESFLCIVAGVFLFFGRLVENRLDGGAVTIQVWRDDENVAYAHTVLHQLADGRV